MEVPDPSPPEQKNPNLSPIEEFEDPWLEGFERSEMEREIEESLSQIYNNTLSLAHEYSRQLEVLDKEIDLKEKAVKKENLEKEKEFIKVFEEREKNVEFHEGFVNKRFGLLHEKEKEFDKKIKLKDEAVKKLTSKLKMKEEKLMKAVGEREKEVEFLNVSVKERFGVLKEKEEEFDLKQIQEAEMIRLVLEKQNEELVIRFKEQEKVSQDSLIERYGVLRGELQAAKEKVGLISKLVDDKSCEWDRKVKEFNMKQVLENESRRKEAELMEMTCKNFETKENELREKLSALEKKETREIEEKSKLLELKEKNLETREKKLEETIKERLCELEKVKKEREDTSEIIEKSKLLDLKEKNLETREKKLDERLSELEKKEREEAIKIKEKNKLLDLKEKRLNEREKRLDEREIKLALKKNEIKERLENIMARKRSRLEVGSSSHRGREADSVISTGKKHKSVRQHNHNDEEREVRRKARCDSQSQSEHTSSANTSEIEEVICIDLDVEEDPELYTCPDPEFHHFNKTMESFCVGQVWALYEPRHLMPRYYAVIKRILQSDLSLRVEWLEPEENNVDSLVCGDFKYGKPDTQSYMAFSHEMHYIKRGNTVTINPKKGETWAIFNEHRKPATCKYKFVEIMSEFDNVQGIGVTDLQSVEGFTSVYERVEQHGLQTVITANEMHKFSHNVPSFKLTGAEREGVPPGSFELDPAAIPRAYLKAADKA